MLNRMSIRTRLNIGITGLSLFICLGTLFILYREAENAIGDQILKRMMTTANSVALQIDVGQYSSLRHPDDENSSAYSNIRSIMLRVKDDNPDIKRIYALRHTNKYGIWSIVADGELDPSLRSRIGDQYVTTTKGCVEPDIALPSAGYHVYGRRSATITGYAPIRNVLNRPVGLIGVDVPADQLFKEMGHIRKIGAFCLSLAVLLSIGLANAFSRILVAPIGLFIARLKSAGRGDLDTLVDDDRSDEIGEVARTFNAMIKSLKHKDEMLRNMNTDYLTGLNNHRYFQQHLQDTIANAGRDSTEVGLLMVDIDRFKLVNDSLGHIIGDHLLTQVAQVLKANTGDKHMVARYGGEEFAIVMPDTSLEPAMELAEKLRAAVASFTFAVPANFRSAEHTRMPEAITITVSIGVGLYPQHSKEQDGLIMAADIALYRAKHLGRDRVCAYSAETADSDRGLADPYHIYTFIKDPTKSTIEALAAAVDARDHYTRNHSENVTEYACMIGQVLGLDNDYMDKLHMASLLHDVGKIGVPDYVLNKPSSLTKDEMEVIHSHPAIGESIIRNSQSLESILPGILYHHERYDGGGYPSGISGDEIPLMARIISVADTFDALTTNRPYRHALSRSEAIRIVKENSGTQFDPAIVDAFMQQLGVEDQTLAAA